MHNYCDMVKRFIWTVCGMQCSGFLFYLCTMCRSIGTFARALLDGAKKPQISLRLGAAAASRDITLFHAMDTLNQNDYDITQATSCLVPRGPVLCADELEAWTQGWKEEGRERGQRGGGRDEDLEGWERGRERERKRGGSYYSFLPAEEAKRFEDGLQEQKDFLSIQRKYVRLL